MSRSLAGWFLAFFVIAAAACGGEASAASTPDLTAHFEPPRSLGTPLDEVARVSGSSDHKAMPALRSPAKH